MKSFLKLLEESEQTNNPVVMTFGRMNPPTTGHLKLIDKVKEIANRMKAKYHIVLSHSQDSKKNPLSPTQKLKHLRRYSPGTHFEVASKEAPTLLHHASRLFAAGHKHLVMVGGSDRVKGYKKLLDDYNGKKGPHGYYNFKKIEVKSAGHRDPDADEKEEDKDKPKDKTISISGSKMREHAKNRNMSAFRDGVPPYISDAHRLELMNDVRKGMGLNESVDRGQFKAIFVTGGPGSGKDIVIREAIASERATEFNFTQILDILNDKHKLAMRSMNPKYESIRTRGPLIINGPADDIQKISQIKEELEELGYSTMMIFVNTNNETSRERNSLLSRMMVESIRQDKWLKSQQNTKNFFQLFENFINFDNTGNLDTKEEDITNIYLTTKVFLDSINVNETVENWLNCNTDINKKFNFLFKEDNVKRPNAKNIQLKTIGKYNPSFRAKGPADIKPDNSGSLVSGRDQIKGDTGPRKDPNGKGHSGGAWHGAYSTEESKPTLKFNPPAKEPNFNYDKDKLKKQKKGDKSLSAGRVGRPDGVGQTYDTRAGGQGAAAGAGLGDQTYSETVEYSNASQNGTAMLGAKLEPNPLAEKKPFDKFRKKIKKEAIDSPGEVAMGVGGVLMGSTNKEPMETYADRKIGIEINKKKKKLKEDHVKELESGLMKLTSHSYNSIDRLMQMIAKKHGITGKNLHDDFKDKHGKIPDDWIKEKK